MLTTLKISSNKGKNQNKDFCLMIFKKMINEIRE